MSTQRPSLVSLLGIMAILFGLMMGMAGIGFFAAWNFRESPLPGASAFWLLQLSGGAMCVYGGMMAYKKQSVVGLAVAVLGLLAVMGNSLFMLLEVVSQLQSL